MNTARRSFATTHKMTDDDVKTLTDLAALAFVAMEDNNQRELRVLTAQIEKLTEPYGFDGVTFTGPHAMLRRGGDLIHIPL